MPVCLSIHTYTQPNLTKRKCDTLRSVVTYYVCRRNVGTAKRHDLCFVNLNQKTSSFLKAFTFTFTFTVHRSLVHVHVSSFSPPSRDHVSVVANVQVPDKFHVSCLIPNQKNCMVSDAKPNHPLYGKRERKKKFQV